MKRVMKRLCVGVLAVAAASMVWASGAVWTFLGERTVTDRVDHDIIAVSAGRGEFSALKIKVKRHAVQFRDMKVVYENGTVQHVELRAVIPAGGESRVIDLVGEKRLIRRIEFSYDAQTLGRKAMVRVFGRR